MHLGFKVKGLRDKVRLGVHFMIKVMIRERVRFRVRIRVRVSVRVRVTFASVLVPALDTWRNGQ